MENKLTIESLQQKHKELMARSFSNSLTQDVSQWKGIIKQRAIDDLPVGVALLDNEYRLQDCNKKYGEYMGRYNMKGKAKAMGKTIFKYMPGIESCAGHVLREVRNSRSIKIELEREIELIFSDGRIKTYWDANLIPLLQQGRDVVGIVLFCLDITEKKTLESIIQHQQRAIEELSNAARMLNDIGNGNSTTIRNNLHHNALSVILPLMEQLKNSRLDNNQLDLISSIENNLRSLTSGFSSQLASDPHNLTQKEITIASLIKEGKTTKEIANILKVSTTTVDFHRNNIRKKLGISCLSVSLRTFLMKIS